MAKKRDKDLFKRMRSLGVRKSRAREVAEAVRNSPKAAPKAARKVKPMPNPPIKIFGRLTDSIRLQVSVASASSDPLSRLFINSLSPSIIENSSPLRFRRSSTSVPGTTAESISSHGIIVSFHRILV